MKQSKSLMDDVTFVEGHRLGLLLKLGLPRFLT